MLLLSVAYAPPIEYFCRLYAYEGQEIAIEAQESYLKQSYRNRCHILGTHGIEALTIPIEHGASRLIRDIRIASHGRWQHQHLQALSTAYGTSPYFEYYWDDIRPWLECPSPWLWELNVQLTECLASLIDLRLQITPTTDFITPSLHHPLHREDYRYSIHPKRRNVPTDFFPTSYYQPFSHKLGFVANLSILDLIFNMGPESLLVLRSSLIP